MRVRPVHGIEEQYRWDRLVATHHYFGFKGFYSCALRHVAVADGAWLRLSAGRRVLSRSPFALLRHLLPRRELAFAGLDARLFPRSRRLAPVGAQRQVQGGLCVRFSGAAPEYLSDEVLEEAVQIPRMEAPAAATLRSLRDFFEEVADFRKACGQHYGLACTLTIAVAARMAGYRGVLAFAEFADLLDDGLREAVGAFWSYGRERWTVPTESTFRYIFSNLDPDALDEALRNWAHHVGDGGPVAMDGKDIRGPRSRSRTSG